MLKNYQNFQYKSYENKLILLLKITSLKIFIFDYKFPRKLNEFNKFISIGFSKWCPINPFSLLLL